MPDTYRVRIVKGADLKAGDPMTFESFECWQECGQRWIDGNMPDCNDEEYLVLDETPGVFLEGVTADDVRCELSIESSGEGTADEWQAHHRIVAALRKAAES